MVIGLAALAATPLTAQAGDRLWRLGVLAIIDDPTVPGVVFPELARRGFVEGRTLVVDVRIGTEDQMPGLARELVAVTPDVILAISDWAVRPAMRATNVIPIVASPMGADPVAAGVAASWARPGANVTGVSRQNSKSSVSTYCAKPFPKRAGSQRCRHIGGRPSLGWRGCARLPRQQRLS
jgi:ABC-type uncharacterized transport system substrate-binding protein